MSIEIREAKIEEVDIVFRTMQEAFLEYSGKLNPPSGALSETTLNVINIFKQGGGAVIAWNESMAVGSARYRYMDHYMHIGRVSVLQEYRGRGICKSLLNFIENKALSSGIQESRVEVRLSIPENIDMYKRLKYEVIEHKFYPERTDSWYVMSKKL